MITLTSNKRPGFSRPFKFARTAVFFAYSHVNEPGEYWTVRGAGASCTFCFEHDSLSEARDRASAIQPAPQAIKAPFADLVQPVTMQYQTPSTKYWMAWTAAAVSSLSMIVYALAFLN